MSHYMETLIQTIEKRNETVYLTIGFRWKNPATKDKPLTPEQAVQWIQESAKHYAKLELKDWDGKLYMSAYTINDMW